MEGIIKVSPQLLTSTASELSNQGATVSSLTTEMMTTITGLASAWEGDAANAYINKFKGLEDDIQKMVRMIQEHSTDLEEMARIYSEADAASVDEANSLSSDVIV
ncbi:WXG100 family type VII secretion target [Frisingicoccus sp.]|uniref:WXG100 family type VII secretion target n=1 Tax=Frisingicoccus sp. TaxID=1918627 RepID=UPI003AB81F76